LKSALGGDGRLRGYPAADTEASGSQSLRGEDVLALNTEFRSRAVDILSAQCGLAAFYDVGGVADRLRQKSRIFQYRPSGASRMTQMMARP